MYNPIDTANSAFRSQIHWDWRISFDLRNFDLSGVKNNLYKSRKEDLNEPLTL